MKKISLISMLIAISLCIFVIEAQIPVPVPFPGVKCGISNVLVLITMILLDRKSAGAVLFLRIILSAVILGHGMSMIYSFFGGTFAFLLMAVLIKPLKDYVWVVSVFGALAHNFGQMLAACIFLGKAVLSYYPVLVISAIITGIFTGIISQCIVKNRTIKKLFGGL